MLVNRLTTFSSLIKVNAARKVLFFDTPITTHILSFVQILFKVGIIRRYLKLKQSKYRIFINWYNTHLFRRKIKFFQTKTPIPLTYKSLRTLNHSTFASTILLDTDGGLVTHKTAIELKKGGHLVCVIL